MAFNNSAKNVIRKNLFTVDIRKNTYVDLYLSDPNDIWTRSEEIRFRLAEAFRQFQNLYNTTASTYVNNMSISDVRFNFNAKYASILRLPSAYQTYVGVGTLYVYNAGQNSADKTY